MLERAGHEFVVRSGDVTQAFENLLGAWSKSKPRMFILDSVDQDKNPSAAAVLTDPDVFSFVVIDDPVDRDVECDLLMNALPGKLPERKRQAGRYLRDTEFLILPVEYERLRERSSRREIGECRRGFAFFGGSDPENLTGVFLDSVAKGGAVQEWLLLLGPANPFAAAAMQRVRREQLPVKIERYVPSMGETLLSADVAVLAAGNTVSEAAAVGTPVIALSHHEIQKHNAVFFEEAGGVVDMGLRAPHLSDRLAAAVSELASDVARRAKMSRSMLAVVDGLGGRRVAEIVAANLHR